MQKKKEGKSPPYKNFKNDLQINAISSKLE